tara:strand:+ start:1044 stop:1277 length:234 start_codon:yes stop_codon:yes gene_type:complete
MEYKYRDIEKIVNYKSWPGRKKIDALLYIDSQLYTQLGINSSLKEKKQTKLKSKNIYKRIGKIDARLGRLFLQSMDS